jgi:hypothetical protein
LLPRRSLLAEAAVGVTRPRCSNASGRWLAVGFVSSTFEISQEDQKDRRSEGGKSAFFNSEDRIEKYLSKVQKQKTSLHIAGGSANPKFSASALLSFL